MILAHSDPPVPGSVDEAVGIAPISFRRRRRGCDRLGLRNISILPIQPTVGEVAEIEVAIINEPGTSAVSVHFRSCAKGRQIDRPVRRSHDDTPAVFLWSVLQPVDVVTVKPDFGKLDRVSGDQVGGDWRLP